MKDRAKSFLEVVLMLIINLVVITLLYIQEGKASEPNECTPDTISEPEFISQLPSEGLISALEYYEIKHPDIVYAQAILETGYFKSSVCINKNNLFGLYNSKKNEYYSFNHWSESVLAYREWIQKRYKPPEDYYDFLQRIRYASDPQYVYKLREIVTRNK